MKPNRLLPLVLLLTALSAHAKDFIIYDHMDYVGKPDLTADKLSKVFLVYESELVKRSDGQTQTRRTQRSAHS